MKKIKRPEWAPKDGGEGFATQVLDPATQGCKANKSAPPPKRRDLSLDEYVKGVKECDRTILGRAITLVESNSQKHIGLAQEMLNRLMPLVGNSIRIGITGIPGAGKSTFIEAFGSLLVEKGHKVAVLAVDPTSSVTRGSILGDKTRMQNLASSPCAFIRPSPSGGILGGVARKSRETIFVCEAAGFDVILVETVGVGQSEVTVRSMVDFFLLMLIAGGGDEIQGMKRGVMELCDAIAVNKADGDNLVRARTAAAEFARILHYLTPATKGWQTPAVALSAKTGEGISELWETILDFVGKTKDSGVFSKRRQEQTVGWVHTLVEQILRDRFFLHEGVCQALAKIEDAVACGHIPPTLAVTRLMEVFEGCRNPEDIL
ncbi:MAG: methylmalonyl Co-A mutase-associated GTPase MeaB [Desulfatibacillaceae bacterium]|nr:methylmalonyl Co-A mutase-associated GTPase MeaB [Desulfatibacillaceae bacterium]